MLLAGEPPGILPPPGLPHLLVRERAYGHRQADPVRISCTGEPFPALPVPYACLLALFPSSCLGTHLNYRLVSRNITIIGSQPLPIMHVFPLARAGENREEKMS